MLTRKPGRYLAREARSQADIKAAQMLRQRCFFPDKQGPETGTADSDRFDALCGHFLIEERDTGRLACCFRMLPVNSGRDISRTYSAQYYELSSLEQFSGPMAEMGRFCIDPDFPDPDILRVAWAEMARYVDHNGVELLFGCASFGGTEANTYLDAFALLKDRHLAPKRWLPKVKAPNVFRFAQRLRRKPDAKRAFGAMPPLLRSYLVMGGWVSDHAVVDQEMNTLHVFTGLEIAAIPATRKRLLRALAY